MAELYIHPKALVESDDIGQGTRIWAFAHVLKGASIGEDCNICDYVFVETGAKIGNGVTIKNGISVWEGITLENHVFVGPYVVFTNDRYPRAHIKRPKEDWLVKTIIREGATIGANSTILCGCNIGAHAFIGAAAFVNQPVKPYALVVGNPIKQIGWVCKCSKRLKEPWRCECGLNYEYDEEKELISLRDNPARH